MPIIGHIWQFQNGFSAHPSLWASGPEAPALQADRALFISKPYMGNFRMTQVDLSGLGAINRHVVQLGSIWAPLMAWSRVVAALEQGQKVMDIGSQHLGLSQYLLYNQMLRPSQHRY